MTTLKFLGPILIAAGVCFVLFALYLRHILKRPAQNHNDSNTIQREVGKQYYTIIGPLIKLEVRRYVDTGSRFDIRNHEMGIYFETESDAEHRIQKIENLNKG